MPTFKELSSALNEALVTARAEYESAVLQLATDEASKVRSSNRELADVDHIHRARTRVIALEAARDELSRMVNESAVPDDAAK